MKRSCIFFRLFAVCMAVASVVCLVIAYWDRIVYFFDCVSYQLRKLDLPSRLQRRAATVADLDDDRADFADFED